MICKVLELKKLNDLSVTGTGTGTGTVVHAPIHYNSFDTVRLFSSGQTPLPVRSPPNLHRTVGEAEEQAARLALLAVHVQRVHGQAAGHLQSGTEQNVWAGNASPSRPAGTRLPYASAVNAWSV